jgi:hypothetical protein
MNPIWIALISIVVIYLAYKIILYCISLTKPSNSLTRVGPEKTALSVASTLVIPGDQFSTAWNGTSGSTLFFFVYPLLRDRTSQSSSEYATVFTVGSMLSLKLLVAPDAGRGYSLAPAQLNINVACNPTSIPTSCTATTRTDGVTETIDLPEIPLQRWTAIAIVRDGSKFNIYLNGKLSTSHMCTAAPMYITSLPLTIGDKRLGGDIALMSIASYALQTNEIRTAVANSVDTSGAPYLSSGISLPLPSLSDIENIVTCPFGNCQAVNLPNPLQQWSSPYA